MNTNESENTRLSEVAIFNNEYITIGKGKTVWYVQSVTLAGLELSAMFTGQRKWLPLSQTSRATIVEG